MSEIQLQAVKKAIGWPDAAGAKYKVIIGDEQFGELEVAIPKPKRKFTQNPAYPRGERTEYIKTILDGLKYGEVRRVPYTVYPRKDIASMVCATSVGMFGLGAVTTNETDEGVDVMRVKK